MYSPIPTGEDTGAKRILGPDPDSLGTPRVSTPGMSKRASGRVDRALAPREDSQYPPGEDRAPSLFSLSEMADV